MTRTEEIVATALAEIVDPIHRETITADVIRSGLRTRAIAIVRTKLAARLQAAGLTQRDIGDIIGVSPDSVTGVIRRKFVNNGHRTLRAKRLARAQAAAIKSAKKVLA